VGTATGHGLSFLLCRAELHFIERYCVVGDISSYASIATASVMRAT
jgi:hypothetical protein